jgi:hypothetical protein
MTIVGFWARGAFPTNASAISIFSAQTAEAVVCDFTRIPHWKEATEPLIACVPFWAI